MRALRASARRAVRDRTPEGRAVVLAAVLSLAIFGLGLYDPGSDAPLLLLCVPVALCAFAFGMAGGAASGLMGLAFELGWYWFGVPNEGATGYLFRTAALVGVGMIVGQLASARKRAEALLQDNNVLLEQLVTERTRELQGSRLEILRRLQLAGEYRDDDTNAHTDRVGRTAALVAQELGLPAEAVELIGLAAPLHDIGKLGISDAVLLKPMSLRPDEFRQMQEHTRIGNGILSGSSWDVLQMAQEIALSHHERWDGSGYPKGLTRNEIPESGRIVAIADVFDALTHARPYKAAWPVEQALAQIEHSSGSHFDPRIVSAFMRLDHHALVEPAVTSVAA
jgi:putative two-component system response regulator